MPTRFGILINEDTIDLIQYLNGGVRPLIQEDTYYLFEMTADNTDTQNSDIVAWDDLWKRNGYRKDKYDNVTLLIG